MEAIADAPPIAPYRRQIDGADFSLEANTPAAPENGRYYLLRRGKVTMESMSFTEANAAYQDLCREYWTNQLGSDQPTKRMASAWGLISLDPEDKDAAEVIRQDGSSDDWKRVEQLRRRRRFGNRKGRFAKKS